MQPPFVDHVKSRVTRGLTGATREVYRRELIPQRVLWWLAGGGMRDWFRVVARRLEPHLAENGTPRRREPAETRALLAQLAARMFARRGEALGIRGADERALPLLMSGLYRVHRMPKARWIFDGLGGAPRGPVEQLKARVLLSSMSARKRWEEVTTHLGELLVVLTEDLPAHLPHARKILGDICFDAGAKYAERVKSAFRIEDVPADPPKVAMEILRMSEYVFRVNPDHWGESDGTSGWLEGTACPWWSRPGWNGAHCGIFGQFQSGIASVFGLRYHLSKTIPKHGGKTCRIDVKPIPLVAVASLRRNKVPA